jgi:hypothetical protein
VWAFLAGLLLGVLLGVLLMAALASSAKGDDGPRPENRPEPETPK